MTPEPPPLLQPRTARTLATPVAWLVIAACVIFIFFHNEQATSQLDETGNPTVAIQLKLLTRVAIGMEAVIAQTGQAAPANLAKNREMLLHDMELTAETPEDKLQVAIAAGEIAGSREALAQLDTLANGASDTALAQDITTLRKIYTDGVDSLDAPAKDSLRQHQGYFAQVALSYGVAASAEPRASLDASATNYFIRFAVSGSIVVVLLLLSVVLFITAIVLVATGKIRPHYVPDPSVNSAFLEGFALYLVAFLALGFALRFLGANVLSWEWLALLIIPLVMYWTARRGVTAEQRKRGFGWHWGRGAQIEIPLGLVGYVAGLPIVAVGILIAAQFDRMSGAHPFHPIIGMLDGNAWQIAFLYFLACGMAPVLEETMFRGALFHHLRRRWGWLASAMVVSLIFAIIHPQGWTLVPGLGAIALVLAAIREWRGSILASMTAHALANFITLTLALLMLR